MNRYSVPQLLAIAVPPVIGFILLAGLLAWNDAEDKREQSRQMFSCVEQGKQWKRDGMTSYYEYVK